MNGLNWWLKRKFNDYLERWTGMHVMNSIPRGSTKFAIEYFKGKRIKCAEIGVYKGYNSIDILKKLNVKKMYLIDGYVDDSEDYKEQVNQWLDNAKKYAFKVTQENKKQSELIYIYQNSDKAYKNIKEKLDFIYIDGNHAKEFVYKDIKIYWNLVAKNGILAGHDFNLQGVAQAVYQFANENNLEVFNLGVDWWYIK